MDVLPRRARADGRGRYRPGDADLEPDAFPAESRFQLWSFRCGEARLEREGLRPGITAPILFPDGLGDLLLVDRGADLRTEASAWDGETSRPLVEAPDHLVGFTAVQDGTLLRVSTPEGVRFVAWGPDGLVPVVSGVRAQSVSGVADDDERWVCAEDAAGALTVVAADGRGARPGTHAMVTPAAPGGWDQVGVHWLEVHPDDLWLELDDGLYHRSPDGRVRRVRPTPAGSVWPGLRGDGGWFVIERSQVDGGGVLWFVPDDGPAREAWRTFGTLGAARVGDEVQAVSYAWESRAVAVASLSLSGGLRAEWSWEEGSAFFLGDGVVRALVGPRRGERRLVEVGPGAGEPRTVLAGVQGDTDFPSLGGGRLGLVVERARRELYAPRGPGPLALLAEDDAAGRRRRCGRDARRLLTAWCPTSGAEAPASERSPFASTAQASAP